MSCIHTFTNHEIDPCDPKISQIYIEDIAHALSLLCRAGGHFSRFYSVAQHSIACRNEAKARGLNERLQLFCLLHDASEAYLADITRPVKKQLPEYLAFESKLQKVIFEKFLGADATEEEKRVITEIDDAVLCNEFIYFTGKNLFSERLKVYCEADYSAQEFEAVEKRFLENFEELYNKNGE